MDENVESATTIKHWYIPFLLQSVLLAFISIQSWIFQESIYTQDIWYFFPDSADSETALLSQLKAMPIYIDSNVFISRRDIFEFENQSIPINEAYRKGRNLPLIYQQASCV